MRVILRPRRNGKTRLAVETFLEQNAVLIVMSTSERERIINEYQIPAHKREFVIVAAQAPRALAGLHRNIIVDNADLILQMYLRARDPITMITVNGGATVPQLEVWEEPNVEST